MTPDEHLQIILCAAKVWQNFGEASCFSVVFLFSELNQVGMTKARMVRVVAAHHSAGCIAARAAIQAAR